MTVSDINRTHPKYVVIDERIKQCVKQGDTVLTCPLLKQQNFNVFLQTYIIGSYFRQVPYNAVPPSSKENRQIFCILKAGKYLDHTASVYVFQLP